MGVLKVNSRLAHILILCSAILAFAPLISINYLLDSYIRMRGMQELKMSVKRVVDETESAIDSAKETLRNLTRRSPSLCTPTFYRIAASEMLANYTARQLSVETPDGNQKCTLYGDGFSYSAITPRMSLPGGPYEMTVVRIPDNDIPFIRMSLQVRPDRELVAFVPLTNRLTERAYASTEKSSMMHIALTSGMSIYHLGDTPGFYDDPGNQDRYIFMEQVASNAPISVSSAIAFSMLSPEYADLKIGFILVASVLSVVFLWLCIQYVQRARAPNFDLERAINDGELRPRYQPVVDLQTGQISGCEVLIRWEKPSGEVISPGAFIEYAELSGLAIPMTLSLMEQVRDDLEDLCDRHPHLKVGINLFEGQFRDGSIVEDVQVIFGATRIRYSQLVFEITERQPLSNMEGANAVIAGLRDLGSKVALDDAGTGHSNLAYIQKLGIDVIKIDRVFVELIKHRDEAVPVVDALIGMANDLGTEIVAEGVETEEQAHYLRMRGIHFAQGFLFAPALSTEAYLALADQINNDEVELIGDLDPGVVNDLTGFADDSSQEFGEFSDSPDKSANEDENRDEAGNAPDDGTKVV